MAFEVYRVPEDHEAIRAAVRSVCTDKVNKLGTMPLLLAGSEELRLAT